jgi:hypothetical protein
MKEERKEERKKGGDSLTKTNTPQKKKNAFLK